jgi:polysaccharide export outer membrane protein
MKYLSILILGAACVIAAPQKSEPAQTSAPAQKPERGYVLGPGDQVLIQVVELPDFSSHPYRVDSDGTVGLPLVGRIRASGLTLEHFENEVTQSLKKQVIDPHVVVSVSEPRSQPVSVIGSVNTPGTRQVQGPTTLFDAIAGAGGLKPEAGNVVTITRQPNEGPLELPNASRDPKTGVWTANITLRDLVDLRDSAANIEIKPHDQISVSRAPVVYVIGNVRKAGGFTVSDGRPISTLEALSLAEGFSPNASPKHARILRKQGNDTISRQEIPVNLSKILYGEKKDVELRPGDILYVPDNLSRRITGRALEITVNTISGVAIWRGF